MLAAKEAGFQGSFQSTLCHAKSNNSLSLAMSVVAADRKPSGGTGNETGSEGEELPTLSPPPSSPGRADPFHEVSLT